jgi:eukaryotic-like serine/threonine-protein kinase
MQLTCPACQRTLDFTGDAPSFCGYCGNSLGNTVPLAAFTAAEVATLAPGAAPGAARPDIQQTVGGYRLLRALGAGGMGEVYEAEESASGRRVALKIINADYADSSTEAVERFRQEGRLASMVTHPRCVFVLAAQEEAGRPYIVMELMPGKTLHDLVKDQGPRPPEQAIAKILDVIDGLQAAHRLEVIHRDVKPSNCFLEADGRVKVGDFGLAKSLTQTGNLTQTGAFVGTLLFASPEQIRGEAIDLRTDVYSVAATLYFLLTGQAPFQSTDMAATLARIVSDPAPSMRRLRPELPAALDQVVLRGLERDPNNRWPDLESFREALVALIPSPLTGEGWGRRVVAGIADAILCSCVSLALLWAVPLMLALLPAVLEEPLLTVFYDCWSVILAILYFTVLEHGWGRSLGKWHERLLVCPMDGHDPPMWRWALARSAVYCGLPAVGSLTIDLALWVQGAGSTGGALWWALWALGWIVLAVPMRPGNGYRGLHEWLSGTRVMQLPLPKKRTALGNTGPWLMYFLAARRLDQQVPQRTSFPERVGGFTIRGVLKWTATDKILLGEDAALGRRVFLWFRPSSEPPLDQARREVGRRTRLRWLASGRLGDLQWDAMLAPLGCPLPELIASDGKLSRAELQPILTELAGELTAACEDGTLPGALNTALVWVQHDGSAQLADIALTDPSIGASVVQGTAQERAQGLLRELTALALAEK